MTDSQTTTTDNASVTRRRLGRLLGVGIPVAAVLGGAGAAEAKPKPKKKKKAKGWSLKGNKQTKSTDFLGTQDAVPLAIRTANVERARVGADGRVGVGTAAPAGQLGVVSGAFTPVTADYTGSGAVPAVQGTSGGGTGAVVGQHSGGGPGVLGRSASGAGVRGEGHGAAGAGVAGAGTSGASGAAFTSDTGTGVSVSTAGAGVALRATTSGTGSAAVATSSSTTNPTVSVTNSSATTDSAAVAGFAGGGTRNQVHPGGGFYNGAGEFVGPNGVIGAAAPTSAAGYGVLGIASNSSGVAVYASASGGANAMTAVGDVDVYGTLTKSGGSFKIDHPLEPATKYLSHSFVESPDMKNLYDGLVAADADGRAEVTMPAWFEALNREFRYQLTAIGGPAPQLHVAAPLDGLTFTIAGAGPGQQISWQVTGTRQDAWAEAHRIPVEEDKPAREEGTYLHPELFGHDVSRTAGRLQSR